MRSSPPSGLRDRALWFAGIFLRPVRALIDGVERIRGGERNVVVQNRSRDEFGDLVGAFNEMSETIRERDELIESKTQAYEQLLRRIFPDAVADRMTSARTGDGHLCNRRRLRRRRASGRRRTGRADPERDRRPLRHCCGGRRREGRSLSGDIGPLRRPSRQRTPRHRVRPVSEPGTGEDQRAGGPASACASASPRDRSRSGSWAASASSSIWLRSIGGPTDRSRGRPQCHPPQRRDGEPAQ